MLKCGHCLRVWKIVYIIVRLLRSRNIPIRDVAMEFGGGGHECASGIKNLTRDQVNQIIEILSNRE